MFVAARFWVAGLVMLTILAVMRRPLNKILWRDGLITGVFLSSAYIAQTIGLDMTSTGKTAFITGLNAAIVPMLSPFLLRVMPSRMAWVGIAVAVGGLALMTLDASLTVNQGDVWVLACAVLFALHIIAVAHYGPKHDPLAFSTTQFFSAAAIATIATISFEGAPIPPESTWLTLFFFGVVATAFTFGVYTWVQPYTTATHAALIYSLEPVAAALFGIFLVGDMLAAREWVGGGLMLLGVIIAEVGGKSPDEKPEYPMELPA